ncbi:MAG TPA: hypothetical protein ENG85_01010 [Bacteroidetes bacterium]|nr:hypothetical protein [Bacteroidota bacterium]
MMFYAGTDSWVYILFGILWIAYAIYKGKEKTARAGKTEENSSSSTSSGLESIMGTFLSEKDITEDIPESREEEVPEKTIAEPEKPVVFEEGVHTTTVGEETSETSSRPKVRKINIKKAIIYSEILRRPYE